MTYERAAHSSSFTASAIRPGPAARALAAGLVAILLAGCGEPVFRLPMYLRDAEDTTQFVTIPMQRTWVNVPQAILATQRGLVNSSEQRLGLPNASTMQGDNVLVLRARNPEGSERGRFRFVEFVDRMGGLPQPFAALNPGDLMTGQDALGDYFWAEERRGDSTVCVLAIRRLTSGMRQLPRDMSLLDVMLRNCVEGTPDDALRPISASSIGNAYGVSLGTADGQSRMLSPLAGPTPRLR